MGKDYLWVAHYTYSQTPAFSEIIQVLQGLLSKKPAAQAQRISLQRPQVAGMMCPELFSSSFMTTV